MRPNRWIFAVAAASLLAAASSGAQPATGTAGMVSTGHPIATRAGLEILAAGGNAFDAAVAVAATLNVVEPMMSGIGGYGTILVYDAKSKHAHFLNASSRIPMAVDGDLFRPPTPGFEENRRGAKAVSTPGNVHAWEAMSQRYGTRPWRTLFAPAIRAADDGYLLGERQAGMIADAFASFPAHAKAIYGHDGRPLAAGERLVQHDLASSLRLIATQGAGAVYGGPLGAAIDSAMQAAGGFLALADLQRDKAEWWDPIAIEYRGVRVLTASPPANSFDALARLGMMERFDLRSLGHNSTAYLHRYAEVTKLGFWMRLRFAGDPEIAPPPVDRLLSAHSLDSLVGTIDTARARPFVPPGAVVPAGLHPTHFVVADRWGNVVSATQTLGNVFGARIMPRGTGIWLNNSLAYSTFEPKGNAMDAFPGRRKLSGDVPVIVLRDGRPWIAIGTPGGHTIGQTVPQMLMNMIDFGMDVQEAIAAPRISFAEPDLLVVEPLIPEHVREELAARGHTIRSTPNTRLGDAHGLTIEYDLRGRPSRFTGGTDPRGEGLAEGWTGAPSRVTAPRRSASGPAQSLRANPRVER
jgi:gamma-glutamyltranspeptidase/glutathione hydrolase